MSHPLIESVIDINKAKIASKSLTCWRVASVRKTPEWDEFEHQTVWAPHDRLDTPSLDSLLQRLKTSLTSDAVLYNVHNSSSLRLQASRNDLMHSTVHRMDSSIYFKMQIYIMTKTITKNDERISPEMHAGRMSHRPSYGVGFVDVRHSDFRTLWLYILLNLFFQALFNKSNTSIAACTNVLSYSSL